MEHNCPYKKERLVYFQPLLTTIPGCKKDIELMSHFLLQVTVYPESRRIKEQQLRAAGR